MKILVVGAGFTGCSLARLMADKGHNILIKEKLNHIGGLSYTTKNSNGILYEPYGARTFHTNDKRVKNFVQRFAQFNTYVHHKGVLINGILRHYPLSIQTIKDMPEGEQILKELEDKPKEPDLTNFETYMVSIFGPTLYKLFVYNYTKKMWGKNPRDLTAEWAFDRIELRKTNSKLFEDVWQGIPIGGYNRLLEKMVSGIPIEFNSNNFDVSNYDLILFSGKIDELNGYKYGALPYRSLRFDYSEDDLWENDEYGTINLPQHPKYVRKANFKILHQQKTNKSWIQYQEPISVDGVNLPMYPINTKENLALIDKYLKESCKSEKIIPVGRLGLYKYLNMDQTISLSMNMVQLIENWETLRPKNRYLQLKELLNNY